MRIHTRTELCVNHPKHGYIVAALPYIDAVRVRVRVRVRVGVGVRVRVTLTAALHRRGQAHRISEP